MMKSKLANEDCHKIELCLITADAQFARLAEKAGIDRIMIDLEKHGKAKRQAGQNLFLSTHREDDIKVVRRFLKNSPLVVRINPLHPESRAEVDRVVSYGADFIMLPMFETAWEADHFINLVRGRTRVSLLLENKKAMENIDDIIRVPGIDEIHIGLNDLRLSLGLETIFEIFCLDILDTLSKKIRHADIRFGFGGVTTPRTDNMPIAPELIIAEQVRLGSSLALLGRSFKSEFQSKPNLDSLKSSVAEIHDNVGYWRKAGNDIKTRSKTALREAVLANRVYL